MPEPENPNEVPDANNLSAAEVPTSPPELVEVPTLSELAAVSDEAGAQVLRQDAAHPSPETAAEKVPVKGNPGETLQEVKDRNEIFLEKLAHFFRCGHIILVGIIIGAAILIFTGLGLTWLYYALVDRPWLTAHPEIIQFLSLGIAGYLGTVVKEWGKKVNIFQEEKKEQ